MLRQFSIEELRGNADSWETLAQDRAEWNSFTTIFVEFVDAYILRADTRAALARDAVAIREANITLQETVGQGAASL